MSNYIDRMKEEHCELKKKVNALNAFIHGNSLFDELDAVQRSKMIKQSGFMESYLHTLESRIWTAIEPV